MFYSSVDFKLARSGPVYQWTNGAWTSNRHAVPQESKRILPGHEQDALPPSPYKNQNDDYSDTSRHDGRLEQEDVEKIPESDGRPQTSPSMTAWAAQTHHEIFSRTTEDGRYFLVKFGGHDAINPNIIPHPILRDVWFIVAQAHKTTDENWAWFTELVCEATFYEGNLQCLKPPSILPVAATSSPHCSGDQFYWDESIGPHDARVFHGPDRPYIIYGTQSQHNCFGLYIHDFRRLVDWKHEYEADYPFRQATDLSRPPPYAAVEKNWFVFWSLDGQIYAHYDVFPERAFAKLNGDGTVEEDLSSLAHESDSLCWNRYMGSELSMSRNHFHQASNSLAITMCAQSDLSCRKTADNTFVLIVFQKKTQHALHSVYEPYIMLFQQSPPFAIHALSTKPIWIHGRRAPGDPKVSVSDADIPEDQSEMLYVTSMNWKDSSRHYHGYLDDIIYLSFGVEDVKTAGIDILASDLLAEIGRC